MSGISMLSRSHERSQNFNQEKAPYSRLYVHTYHGTTEAAARVVGGGGSCAAPSAWLRQGCCLIHDGDFFLNFLIKNYNEISSACRYLQVIGLEIIFLFSDN